MPLKKSEGIGSNRATSIGIRQGGKQWLKKTIVFSLWLHGREPYHIGILCAYVCVLIVDRARAA